MKHPKSFVLKGNEWTFKFRNKVEWDGEKCNGLIDDYDKKIILIQNGLSRKVLKKTIYHELVHVILDEAHLNHGMTFNEDMEEIICEAIANAWDQLFIMKWKNQNDNE